MDVQIPQWYFWVLIGCCVIAVCVLFITYIQYRQKKKKDQDVLEEEKDRAAFRSRGNISGKRQVFTLRRTPYDRVKDTDLEKADPESKPKGADLMSVLGATKKTGQGTSNEQAIWPGIELKKLKAATNESTDEDLETNRTASKVRLEKSDPNSDKDDTTNEGPKKTTATKWNMGKMPKIAN